jgi:hypothetical protein
LVTSDDASVARRSLEKLGLILAVDPTESDITKELLEGFVLNPIATPSVADPGPSTDDIESNIPDERSVSPVSTHDVPLYS